MEKFIVYSKEYRHSYAHFVHYLQAIGYSPASCATFKPSIKEFLGWLERNEIRVISQVKEDDIQNFYSYHQERAGITTGIALSESRISITMYVLKIFFQHLQDIDQLDVNPMSNLEYTASYKRTRENLVSREDIEKLYHECESVKQRAILGIIYGCGLRRQEAVRLNAKDIHFRTGMLYVRQGKGGRKRTIPLSKTVSTDLKDYYHHQRPSELRYGKGNPEAFMLNKFGTRMQGETYLEEIKRLIRKAKLDSQITLHHFRHAIATHLLESGMKTEHVKDFLGHQSIVTTQTYTHITIAQLKKITAYGNGT